MKFPNETKAYRTARDDLLKAEIDLRRQIEKVAALRRSLPVGGEVPEDYVFDSERGKVKLSQFFERGPTLVAYSFMYGPRMQKPCPMCTAMLDGLNGNAQHVGQRTNLVVIAKSPLERTLAYARERGWLKNAGKLRHFFGTELLYAREEKGQNARHVDLIWPLWNLLDLTPEGRGTDWYPKLSY